MDRARVVAGTPMWGDGAMSDARGSMAEHLRHNLLLLCIVMFGPIAVSADARTLEQELVDFVLFGRNIRLNLRDKKWGVSTETRRREDSRVRNIRISIPQLRRNFCNEYRKQYDGRCLKFDAHACRWSHSRCVQLVTNCKSRKGDIFATPSTYATAKR